MILTGKQAFNPILETVLKTQNIVFLLFICGFSYGTNKNQSIKNTDTINSVTELIKDKSFSSGFRLTPLLVSDFRKNGYTDTISFTTTKTNPTWTLAQWYSNHDLKGAKLRITKSGIPCFENKGKKLALYPDSSLLLELNAGNEYKKARTKNEQWPHLLIEQKFTDKPFVSSARKIIFSMELMLVNCENKMSVNEFETSLHTAQSPFFLNIKDSKSNSFIWFGIRSFDYRYPKMSDEPTTSWDLGTKTFISTASPKAIWGDIDFNDKKWHTANTDILPYIREAFNTVKSMGHFPNTRFEDLIITGMNFGWEIPGTFDASLRIKNISIKMCE